VDVASLARRLSRRQPTFASATPGAISRQRGWLRASLTATRHTVGLACLLMDRLTEGQTKPRRWIHGSYSPSLPTLRRLLVAGHARPPRVWRWRPHLAGAPLIGDLARTYSPATLGSSAAAGLRPRRSFCRAKRAVSIPASAALSSLESESPGEVTEMVFQ
jgi:hypothetical protein